MTTTLRELEQRVPLLLAEGQAIVIRDPESYERAASFLLVLKEVLKEIDATFAPITKKAHETWKETLAQRQRHEAPLLQAERLVKSGMGTYLASEEQRRLEAQRQAQEDAQLAEALHYEAMGDPVSANDTLNGQGVVNIHLESSVPQVSGIASYETWSAEVMDLMALVKAVAVGRAPLAYLLPNLVALNQSARAIKEALNQVPGIKVVRRTTVAVGRR